MDGGTDPFYPEAWWATLGLTSGRMKTTQEFYHNRYHDGYVSCEEGSNFTDCSGTLLGTYVQASQVSTLLRDNHFPVEPPG